MEYMCKYILWWVFMLTTFWSCWPRQYGWVRIDQLRSQTQTMKNVRCDAGVISYFFFFVVYWSRKMKQRPKYQSPFCIRKLMRGQWLSLQMPCFFLIYTLLYIVFCSEITVSCWPAVGSSAICLSPAARPCGRQELADWLPWCHRTQLKPVEDQKVMAKVPWTENVFLSFLFFWMVSGN